MNDRKYTSIVAAADVTEEILGIAKTVFDGWYAEAARIDWTDFLDRMDGRRLDDGTLLDLGSDLTVPAIVAIKKWVRAYKQLGQ